MKKTILALAAFSAASAFAADSVTIYGIADSWFGQTKVGAAPTQTVVQSGGLSTSRLGFSIKEDLGDGLGAFAVIEDQINLDNGTKGAAGRKYVVGLSGDFGSVSLGRQATPFEDFYTKSFYTMDSAFDGMKQNGRAAGYTHTARIDNGVRYDSPNFDGFTASAHLGLGEDKAATVRARQTWSLSARYSNGPLVIGLAHQKDEVQALPATINRTTNTVIAGSYDFGAAKVNLGYNMAKKSNVAPKENSYNLGVVVPAGAFSFLAQVGQSKVSNGGAKTNSFGLEGRYALSKRTTVYAGAGQSKISGAANPNIRNIGVGIRHTF